MNISKIMTKKVIVTDENASIDKVLAIMDKEGIKEVPVLADGKYKGMLIYYDLLSELVSGKEKVKNYVRKTPTLSPKQTIEETIRLMTKSGITGLPVIDEGRVIGIVSDFDIFRLLINNHVFDNLKVLNVLIRKFPILRQEDSIEKALKLISINNVDSLPVIDNFGKIVGEVFLSDILSYVLNKKLKNHGKLDHEAPEGESDSVMTIIKREVPPISETLNLRKALEIMLLSRMKAIVVSDMENRPIGILSRLKILSLLSGMNIGEQIAINLSGDYDLDFGLLVRSEILQHERILTGSWGMKEINIHVKKIKGPVTSKYEISILAIGKKKIALKVDGISKEQIIKDLIEELISTIERSKR